MIPSKYAMHKAARRVRTAAGLGLRYVAEPRLGPYALPIGTWWWDGKQNFGDRLTDFLLPNYGIAPYHASRKRARLFGVGSTIDATLPDYSGYFWGTGKYIATDSTPRKNATYLAVRGPLTRDLLELPEETPLGDPGLLISKHVPALPTREQVGLVAHFTHIESSEIQALVKRLGHELRIIDVRRPTVQVVREISECSAVVSTSLHGVITADAYDVPAVWAMPEPVLTGGDFKFRDYEAVVHPENERCHSLADIRNIRDLHQLASTVSRSAVQSAQAGLENALQVLLQREGRHARRLALPLHVAKGILHQW